MIDPKAGDIKELVTSQPLVKSKAGYWFDQNESVWVLDKNNTVYLSNVKAALDADVQRGFVLTLSHYARTKSAAHTRNICDRINAMVRDTGATGFGPEVFISYRSTLSRETEWYLATVRGFFYKWRSLGYPGINDDTVELLKGWSLKGNIKGDAVKRLDANEGPLSDYEVLAFNEGAVRAFEHDLISLQQLSIGLCISHTGRRPIQICHLKICDLDGTKKNNKSEPIFLIHIPRAKQQGEAFRDSFKTFLVTYELWVILDAQRKNSIALIEEKLGYQLQENDRRLLPLFPDLNAFTGIASVVALRELIKTDHLHMKASFITPILREIVAEAQICSERSGKLLDVVATRFRYTKGTKAAREGLGKMIIAELLDHSDTQNADVYIKNLPEHAHALNRAMALQMAPFAQAFQGVIVDREADAKRGDDPTSRIKYQGADTATCGQYGFCGANAPIPCYTCQHFQPWLDGPHEEVLVGLLAEREEVEKITGDETMAAVNDRTIFAVIDVIQRCNTRRTELSKMAAERA